ncbi:hypothetical protein, partial [Salipiger mangrovisoli]|uniref:hypothetical protein n=1 Tax=Salipiger mangrovisoli TaxID=2865933 RepID=UPI001F120121
RHPRPAPIILLSPASPKQFQDLPKNYGGSRQRRELPGNYALRHVRRADQPAPPLAALAREKYAR